MRKKILPVTALVLAAAVLSACQLLPEEETLPPMPVIRDYEVQQYKYVTVQRGDLVASATVRVAYALTQKQQLSFPVDGLYIESVAVTEGQQVEKGMLLATLEQTELQPQLAAQRHAVNMLCKEKEHLQQTLELELAQYDGQLASLEQQLQQLQAQTPLDQQAIDALLQQKTQLEQARAAAQSTCDSKVAAINDSVYVASLRLEELEAALEKRQLIAGIDGVVTFLQSVEEGQRSVKGERFITIADLSSAAFTAEAAYAAYFPLGTEVVITCGGKEYEAIAVDAAALGMEAPPANEPAPVYFQLEQPDPSLAENVRGIITVIQEQRTDVLYVHKKAIRTANGETFVYLLDEDGLRTMRSVTTGLEAGNFVQIITGVDEGDRVIAE